MVKHRWLPWRLASALVFRLGCCLFFSGKRITWIHFANMVLQRIGPRLPLRVAVLNGIDSCQDLSARRIRLGNRRRHHFTLTSRTLDRVALLIGLDGQRPPTPPAAEIHQHERALPDRTSNEVSPELQSKAARDGVANRPAAGRTTSSGRLLMIWSLNRSLFDCQANSEFRSRGYRPMMYRCGSTSSRRICSSTSLGGTVGASGSLTLNSKPVAPRTCSRFMPGCKLRISIRLVCS